MCSFEDWVSFMEGVKTTKGPDALNFLLHRLESRINKQGGAAVSLNAAELERIIALYKGLDKDDSGSLDREEIHKLSGDTMSFYDEDEVETSLPAVVSLGEWVEFMEKIRADKGAPKLGYLLHRMERRLHEILEEEVPPMPLRAMETRRATKVFDHLDHFMSQEVTRGRMLEFYQDNPRDMTKPPLSLLFNELLVPKVPTISLTRWLSP